MSSQPVPLSLLEPVPSDSHGYAASAVADTVDLAWQAERLGFRRLWIAEHHLAPVAPGPAPGAMVEVVASATERLRVGAGTVRLGHRSARSAVEEFDLIGASHPGRIDLGIGQGTPAGTPYALPTVPGTRGGGDALLASAVGGNPNGEVDGSGRTATAFGMGTRVEPWILGGGTLGGQLAGERGLRFAANYATRPWTAVQAAAAYRRAFRPSAQLAEPYVLVQADVLTATDAASARLLAAGHALWVHAIRTTGEAIPFPSPDQTLRHPWTDADRALVADRLSAQFVGTPETVTARLRLLREAAGADELLLTTVTHDHEARLRSYELLARAWCQAD